MGHRFIAALVVMTAMVPLLAQNAARPVPRHADGRINFGPPQGEVGIFPASGRSFGDSKSARGRNRA